MGVVLDAGPEELMASDKSVAVLRSAEPGVRVREWLRVYGELRPKLASFFLGRTRNREDAEDLPQELFLKIHEMLMDEQLLADKGTEAYVWKVAHTRSRGVMSAALFLLSQPLPRN